MVQIPINPNRNWKHSRGIVGPIGQVGPIGIRGYPGIQEPLWDEDLIRFCIALALKESQILRISVVCIGKYNSMIDVKLDKFHISSTIQAEKILSDIRNPLVGDIMKDIPNDMSNNTQVIINIRIYKGEGGIRYHTKAKVKDGKTYVRKGLLTKSLQQIN